MARIDNPAEQGAGAERLSPRFRRLDVSSRRREISRLIGDESADFESTGESDEMSSLADVLVESAIGYMPVPVGVAAGFLIDGEYRDVPLATEEPSVIAAATYAASIIAGGSGFTTWSDQPIMTGTVYFEGADEMCSRLSEIRQQIVERLEASFERMKSRGGGLESMAIDSVGRFARIIFGVNVLDAMGANAINTAAESVSSYVRDRTGDVAVMSILSNAGLERRAGARFEIDASDLPRRGEMTRDDVARRVCLAYEIADTDERRAVTHNKGIMNGITALALATGNDTRGIEAAAHAFASNSGRYRPLTRYEFSDGVLAGSIELPLPMATVGGATSFHPAARAHIALTRAQSSSELSRIAAAVGLAQNFAALFALVSGGVQSGHMRLHARRLAYSAGARGRLVEAVAKRISSGGVFNADAAAEALAHLSSGGKE